jgi:hypothetical protein
MGERIDEITAYVIIGFTPNRLKQTSIFCCLAMPTPEPLNILDKDPFFCREADLNADRNSNFHGLDIPTLTIIDRWTLSVVPFSSTPSGHRRRPLLFRESKEIGITTVKASQAILTGRNRWSQVWLGGVTSHESAEASVVAIKVFQESLFPVDDELDDWAKPARTEASSYRLMRHLQG